MQEDAAAAADRAAFEGAGIRGVDAEAFANPLLPPPELAIKTEEAVTEEAGGDDRMPLALEATEGIAPELTTHKESAFGNLATGGGELSPEEQAIHGVVPGSESGDVAGDMAGEGAGNGSAEATAEGPTEPDAVEASEDPSNRIPDEDEDTAALAEGRAYPPRGSGDEGR